MQFLAALLIFGTIVYAKNVQPLPKHSPTHGYMKNIGIPLAEKIRQAEETNSRIIGGVPTPLGKYPFMAGVVSSIIIAGEVFLSVCGGALISTTRVLTAGHCWDDGVYQAWTMRVVLGATQLFTGSGTSISTSNVVMHPNWGRYNNDIAIARFANPVAVSDTIAPIALPSGSDLLETFAGESATALGFGTTSAGGSIILQPLNHVSVDVITNSVCSSWYPFIIQTSHLCTTGLHGAGFCQGDTGGPLVVYRNDGPILVGVAAFYSGQGCQSDFPKVYNRVTSSMDFINQNL